MSRWRLARLEREEADPDGVLQDPRASKQVPSAKKQVPSAKKRIPIEKRQISIEKRQIPIEKRQISIEKRQIPIEKHAEAAVTVASKGSVVAVKAWGCVVAGRTTSTPTDEAPQNLSAKNTRTPGDVVFRCKGIQAQAYVYQHADNPTFPAGAPAPVVLSTATYTLTGLAAGQKIYFRAAVIRRGTGQSKWSEPVQLTVR